MPQFLPTCWTALLAACSCYTVANPAHASAHFVGGQAISATVQNETQVTTATRGAQEPLDATDYIVFRDDHPLRNARLRFERDRVGTVVFLGGSITAGGGWRDQVCADLRRRFPDTDFTFVNAGIPSTGSITGAMRFARDVLAHHPVDLLFEEAAVNDAGIGFSDQQQQRGMEGIVRHALTGNPLCDVVVMHFVDPGKIRDYSNNQTPQTIINHERVTEHYGVTTIHLAKEVTERIAAGEFTWADDFRNLHPSPFGHRLYAHTIATMFDLAWANELADDADLVGHELPEPLDPMAYAAAVVLPPGQATDRAGFEVVDSWRPTDGARTRAGFFDVPMLVGTQPGDSCTLAFNGTTAGIWVVSGPDAGIVESRVDNGAWQQTNLFGRASASLHLPRMYLLADGVAPGDHTLELRITPQAHERSTGTACRIVGFVVNASATTAAGPTDTITFEAADGLIVTADLYLAYEDKTAPLLILYHQAGWSRGEYNETAPKLNALGFNCFAVDARAGRAVNDVENETALSAQDSGLAAEYPDAYPDLEAALAYAHQHLAEGKVIVVGSSYSAALVFKLAAEHPDQVDGVAAFSPAVRGWNERWLLPGAESLACPVFITSAGNEGGSWQSIADRIDPANLTTYLPETQGQHGSRALWEQFDDHVGYWVAFETFLVPLAE